MALVKTAVDGRVAVMTLDDPDRRNAMSPAMVDDILAAFDRLEADASVGAVVLTGTPPVFCAGADLSDLEGAVRDGLARIYEGFLRVARSPLPTVAAVNGPAIGAGVNLALACDLRIAARAARFESRFLELGLHPGGGHVWMLQQICGPQTAAAMVLFGEPLEGKDAERRGLVWRCVNDGELMPTATGLARRAADVPAELSRRAKATVREMAYTRVRAEAVAWELEHQAWSVEQPEFRERLATLRRRLDRR